MTNRYQKEIEEILKKAGEQSPEQQPDDPDEPPRERRPRRRSTPTAQGGAMRRASISYKHLLLVGVGVLIVSIFVGGLPVFLVGAGLLVAGYIWYYRAPRSGGGGSSRSGGGRQPKMWRGRMIDPGRRPALHRRPLGQTAVGGADIAPDRERPDALCVRLFYFPSNHNQAALRNCLKTCDCFPGGFSTLTFHPHPNLPPQGGRDL